MADSWICGVTRPTRPPFITEAATEAEADVIVGRIRWSSSSPPSSGSETMTTPDVFVVVIVIVGADVLDRLSTRGGVRIVPNPQP